MITRGSYAQDYVSEDCVLFIREHSAADIRQGVEILLKDIQRAELLAKNAPAKYKEKFTLEQFGTGIAGVLKIIERAQ